MHRRRLTATALLGLSSCLALGGCFARPVQQEVYSEGTIEVSLRSEVRWFDPIEKDFQHPVTIASVRVAHILSRIDLRPNATTTFDKLAGNTEEKRVGAIATDMLFPIAEGVSKALAEATADQEVVVMAVHETKRFGIFDHDYLTSFVAYVRDERLYLHLSRHEWEIPPRRDERLPVPRAGDHPQRFKLFPSTAMALVDNQSVAIDWRDPVFSRPTRTKILPSGEVVRKTILMESPLETEEIRDPARSLPDDLTPEQLRALADVEELRRQGKITEADYRMQRRKILDPEP